MSGTIAFDVKKALITKVKADSSFASLVAVDAIWDSSYAGEQRPRQLLWFGEITWEEDVPTSSLRRVETFDIRFGIEIHDADDTQTAANDKVETILQALEALINDYRVLQIGGIESLGVVPIGLGEGADTTGRIALFAGQVHVRARK